MNRRCLACVFLLASLLPCLPAFATPSLPLRVRLRVVEGCPLDHAVRHAPCAVAHQRSDAAPASAPPQVQALTPPVPNDGGSTAERTWLTITF